MVEQFGGNYWHALDKDGLTKYSAEIKEIGISHGIGDSLQGLKANIFVGAPIVELGFAGAGKGQRGQAATPESYGKDEREAMRQLAKVNEVKVTTHSSFRAPPLSGFAEGGFNKDVAASSVQELRKAIDFATDVAQGGPVVVHTGEWQRPVKKEEVFGKAKFEAYEGEPETVQFANTETGEVRTLRSDLRLPIPKAARPGVNPWEEPLRDKRGDIIFEEKPLTLKEIAEKQNKKLSDVYSDFLQNQLNQSRGQAEEYKERARTIREQFELIKNTYKEVERFLEKGETKNAELTSLQFLERSKLEPPPGTTAYKEYLKEGGAVERLKEIVKRETDTIKGYEEFAAAREFEAKRVEQEIGSSKPIEEVGLKRTAQSVSTAAMYAYDKEKKAGLKEPIFIAPENVFAETYGGRPDELRKIIQESRKEMTRKLVEQKKMSEEEAKNVAKEHIKATIDIGHAYTWRKYFSGSDEDFKKWLLKEMKDLAKDGIIGHVHLTDNFGYDDEHLTIGEGKVPVREFIDEIKKEGYKGIMIAEVGGQPEGKLHEALLGSWRSLNSPIYRIDPGGTGMGWGEFANYSFGMTPKPLSILGEYAPSEEFRGAPFYSGLGLE
ncbi:hypothetical protein HY498_05510 [Candidatus Woesearchaeota archaeon]|nr:hypothetical protein [Candidatus Woesearchaeota archaeon]